MHRFFIKTPWLAKQFYPNYVWHLPRTERAVYLTFDDGPHPAVTPWVLQQLKRFDAKATFFCVGENVEQHPDVYRQILAAGHAVGNHSQHHPNGWHTPTAAYVADVAHAAKSIESHLFRPPYGRIKRPQATAVKALLGTDAKIIMWDVLSCDFDPEFSKEQCLKNVMQGAEPGSIIVFHDSEKSAPNMMHALPEALKQLSEKGYAFKRLH